MAIESAEQLIRDDRDDAKRRARQANDPDSRRAHMLRAAGLTVLLVALAAGGGAATWAMF